MSFETNATAKYMSDPKSYAECRTDEERAQYIANHNVLETGEFVEIGEAEEPMLETDLESPEKSHG